MRKLMALAITAVMMTGLAAAPAQAVTSKAGTKCTVRIALAKQGGTKFYCGLNRNAKTKKHHKLAWIRSAVCYNGIVEFRKTDAQYKGAKAQIATIKAQLATMDSATQASMAGQVNGLDSAITQLGPVAKALGDGIRQLCP